jgi:uncharacterized membrane protein (DUF4010 family)
VFLFGPVLMPMLAPALGAAAVVSALAALVLSFHAPRERKGEASPIQNPFELRFVLGFAVLLAAVLLVTRIVTEQFGGAGNLVIAAIAGVADVDAITLSMTRLAGGPDVQLAAISVLIAVAANSASKVVMALGVGGRRFGLAYTAVTAAAVAAGAVVALVSI